MHNITLIFKPVKSISYFCLLLLLSACSNTTRNAYQVIQNAEKLITEAKKSPLSAQVTDDVLRAESNLESAKQALENGNEAQANLEAQKAESDAELAKAKIATSVYGKVAKNQEKNLKKHQEIYK